MSKIEWTDETWNPVTGCTKMSQGCKNCYAERMARRLQAMGQTKYRRGFEVTCHPSALEQPLHWRQPRWVFVCSMSDLFHEQVPSDFIESVLDVVEACPQHTFQFLTKRSQRLSLCRFPPNVWAGVTVENRSALPRIEHLRRTQARIRFLSIEPLLEQLIEDPGDLDLTGIHWVIVGGESGPGARPMDPDWARSIRDQCVAADVPFFFKQHGGVNKKKAGRDLDGRAWGEMP